MAARDSLTYKPIALNTHAFMPSIHWAEHQRLMPTQGGFRRLYDGELMYVHAGSIQVEFADNGEQILYEAGDLLVLAPGSRHRIAIVQNAHLLGIHFDLYDELDLDAVGGDMVVVENQVSEYYFCGWPVQADGAPALARCYRSIPQNISAWMEELHVENKIQRPGYQTACRGYMQLIITALLRLQQDMKRSLAPAYGEALLKLVQELHQNMHASHTNSDMAQRLNISEDYFIRLFKQQFDQSPQQYLQHIRHQAAKRYLRETDFKIEQIGALVGYEDLQNFSHAFKKWQGVSPRAYRKLFSIL